MGRGALPALEDPALLSRRGKFGPITVVSESAAETWARWNIGTRIVNISLGQRRSISLTAPRQT